MKPTPNAAHNSSLRKHASHPTTTNVLRSKVLKTFLTKFKKFVVTNKRFQFMKLKFKRELKLEKTAYVKYKKLDTQIIIFIQHYRLQSWPFLIFLLIMHSPKKLLWSNACRSLMQSFAVKSAQT